MPPSIPLLIADASALALGALLAPPWGVYLNGVAVIQPASVPTMLDGIFDAAEAAITDVQQIAALIGVPSLGPGVVSPATASTVEFEFAQDWPLSNYPQEQGAFQTYNKQTLPFDVKLRLASGGGQAQRQAFLQTVLAIGASFELFDIVTPELTFAGVNCTHVDWRREARRGVTLLQPTLWFQQVPVVNSATFQNTQQPGEAGVQAGGAVQPQTPAQYVQSQFAAGGWQVLP